MENKNSVFTAEAAKHRNFLLQCAINLTKNRDNAEDLVQETYFRAYRFFDSYKVGSNCKSWLFKILRNQFLNYIRMRENIESKSARFKDNEYLFYTDPKSYDESISEYLLLSVNRIKDDYRTLIILFYFENYSLDEISEYLNWPIGTVKSRLHRARAELRKLL